MAEHRNITVHGRVQGVFFRASTQQAACEYNIRGFVRNEPDGTVYIEAEGDPEELQQLIDWCQEGSPQANVEKVETEEGEMKNYDSFDIRY